MKKTVIGMAMMAMALVGFNGMAQSVSQSSNTQVENKACCKAAAKDAKGGKMQARAQKNLYEGLTLTDAQKAKLAELDAKQQAKRQAKMEARKAEGQKADRSNMTEEQIKAAMQARQDARKAEKMEYLQEVKEIIGPDQYVVFLENIYVNDGQQGGPKAFKQGAKGAKKGMAHSAKSGKGQRKADRKGDRRGQQQSASAAQS